MRFWLLSHLKDSPGNRIFEHAARGRGHQVELRDPAGIDLNLAPSHTFDELPDLVFTRMGSSAPAPTLHVLQALESAGVPCVNGVEGLRRSRDKARAYLELARAGVPVPATSQPGRGGGAGSVPGPPWIVKLPVGTKGEGVMLAESAPALKAMIASLQGLGQAPLVQEFIQEAGGADVRVLVLGGRASVAARRQGREGEFRSNLHLGGEARPVTLTADLARVAEAATEALGLDVAGVDLLESRRGPLVVEVNGSPGMTASPEIVERLLDYLEGRVTRTAPL